MKILSNVNNLDRISDGDTYKKVSSTEKTTWNNKQDKLTSGTNIKTVNGNSLLGSGNITISGGGSADNVTTRLNSDNETEVIGIYTTQNSARKIWEGTKAQYDAIATKDENTYYYITDDGVISYNDLADKPTIPTKTSQLTNDSGFITSSYHDSTKQNTLVSGTNIKTINSQSLLGSGNIDIQGGGTSKKVLVNYTVTADATQIDLKTMPDGTPIPLITGDLIIRFYIPYSSGKTMPTNVYTRFINQSGTQVGTLGYVNCSLSGALASKDRLVMMKLYRNEDVDGSNVRYDGFTSTRSATDTTNGSAQTTGGTLTNPSQFTGFRITDVIAGQKIYIAEV